MNCPSLSLPESFFEEDVRSGFAVTPERKKIWAVELDLLARLQQVCEKHHIRYYADGGTLLGAVRHSGFIPWDDDVDIVMVREDYQKLCSVAAAEFTFPYFFQTEQSDPGSQRGHAQLRNSTTTGILRSEWEHRYSFNQGIFIDIFPLDAIPEEENERTGYVRKADRLRRQARAFGNRSVRFNKSKNNVLRLSLPYYLGGRWFKRNPLYERYEKHIQKYNDGESPHLASMFQPGLRPGYIYDRLWFAETTGMPFEVLTVPVFIGYLEHLRRLYGDWETPVKSDTVHGNVIFDPEVSYTDYVKMHDTE